MQKKEKKSDLPALYYFHYFECVARVLSFSKAANELCVTQSAISKQIKNLELHLGFPLFERQHRKIKLTTFGQELYEHTQPLLAVLRDSIAHLQQLSGGGIVSVVCTHAVAHYWLVPRLEKFNQLRPDIQVNVISTNNLTSASCIDNDFAILIGKGQWRDLNSDKLFDEIVYPVCSSHFNLPDINNPADLLNIKLIQLNPKKWIWMTWADWFAHFDVAYTEAKAVSIYNQVTLALHASASGHGVALGWEFMARGMIDAGLLKKAGKFVYITGLADYLTHSKKRKLSPAAIFFKEFLLANP